MVDYSTHKNFTTYVYLMLEDITLDGVADYKTKIDDAIAKFCVSNKFDSSSVCDIHSKLIINTDCGCYSKYCYCDPEPKIDINFWYPLTEAEIEKERIRKEKAKIAAAKARERKKKEKAEAAKKDEEWLVKRVKNELKKNPEFLEKIK